MTLRIDITPTDLHNVLEGLAWDLTRNRILFWSDRPELLAELESTWHFIYNLWLFGDWDLDSTR